MIPLLDFGEIMFSIIFLYLEMENGRWGEWVSGRWFLGRWFPWDWEEWGELEEWGEWESGR